MRKASAKAAALAIGAVLLTTACGGNAAENTSTTTAAVATTTTITTTAAPATTSTQAGSVVPELAGTNWRVVNYRLDEWLTNVWPDSEVTLRFGEGTVAGFTGCNDYGGNFAVTGGYDEFVEGVRDANDGQAIVIGQISATEQACEPSRIMDQEGEYLALLQSAERWVIARGLLLLRSADGTLLIEAEPAD